VSETNFVVEAVVAGVSAIGGAFGGMKLGVGRAKGVEARLALLEYRQDEAVKVSDRQNKLLDQLFKQSEEIAIKLAGLKGKD